MSRVFVSCAYKDRAVGAELGSIVRSLGHEPADDHDEARGTAWWNEVVRRIEASDVFVAVATPAYASAHTCRLAAKHAAATGMPVVRVDLGDRGVPDCPPVVADAIGVPFSPRDPAAVVRLAQALAGSPSEVANGTARPAAASRSPEQRQEDLDPAEPDEPADLGRRLSTLEIGVAVVLVLIAAGLLYLGRSHHGPSEPSAVVVPSATPSAEATPTGGPEPDATSPTTPAEVSALLAGVNAADSPRLPASACQAGATAVTCMNPAPNISTVVLTPYQTPAELYAAYTAQVESLSGAPIEENTGNCSNTSSDGELGWNLDKAHTLDYSIAEQEAGGLDPASESAGRVFCTAAQKVMNLVWTQDPGLLVTATGQPSELVITWWGDVHLQLAGSLAAE